MVQTSTAYCEKEEAGELGALKYCEPGICLGRDSIYMSLKSTFSLKNGTEHV